MPEHPAASLNILIRLSGGSECAPALDYFVKRVEEEYRCAMQPPHAANHPMTQLNLNTVDDAKESPTGPCQCQAQSEYPSDRHRERKGLPVVAHAVPQRPPSPSPYVRPASATKQARPPQSQYAARWMANLYSRGAKSSENVCSLSQSRSPPPCCACVLQ